MRKLKHERYKVGQKIKAFDFEPMTDREDRYVIGTITKIQTYPYKAYVVEVENDTMWPENPRKYVYAPMEIGFLEYDDRISLWSIPTAPQK